MDFAIDADVIIGKDERRRRIVLREMAAGKIKTADDWENAALVLQHSSEVVDLRLASVCAQRALSLRDTRGNRWLYAATLDRSLIVAGEKQKFGTQYGLVVTGDEEMWIRLPCDGTITDSTRLMFGVEPVDREPDRS